MRPDVQPMQKQAAVPLVVLAGLALNGLLAGSDIYNLYSKNRDSQYGYGDASDLHGFIGENGLIGRPNLAPEGLAAATYFIPFAGPLKWLKKVPVVRRVPNLLLDSAAHIGVASAIPGMAQNPREQHDRYYRMRQSLADAGITVGRNGSNEGIVNNSRYAPRHVVKRYTGEQKRKLREHMIDPSTGAPIQGWDSMATAAQLMQSMFPSQKKIEKALNPGFNMNRRLYGYDR